MYKSQRLTLYENCIILLTNRSVCRTLIIKLRPIWNIWFC